MIIRAALGHAPDAWLEGLGSEVVKESESAQVTTRWGVCRDLAAARYGLCAKLHHVREECLHLVIYINDLCL